MAFLDEKDIQDLREKGGFSPLDLHFAEFMADLSGGFQKEVFIASALVSRFTSEGHVCLDLSSVSNQALYRDELSETGPRCPELEKWVETLDLSTVAGPPGDYRPLILDHKARLYLYRYWYYESSLARELTSRAGKDIPGIDLESLGRGLVRHFGASDEGEADRQKVAAFQAVTKGLCIVSGGPGTGKSSLIGSILSLISEQETGLENRVSFAAPTGKAAARMEEAVKKTVENLFPNHNRLTVPEASTIHRLLGTIPGSPYFRHNTQNPLPCDILFVDEVSMVDLALLSKLVTALPPEARLIMFGDKDQLSSVEAGAVLGDICSSGGLHTFSDAFREKYFAATGETLPLESRVQGEGLSHPAIRDSLVELNRNYRFGPYSGIGRVSTAVKEGDAAQALGVLKAGDYTDAKWKQLPPPNHLKNAIEQEIIQGYEPYLTTNDIDEKFALFDNFRILCVTRRGPYGLWALNHAAEQVLKKAGLINPAFRWYPGRPILITRNDYNLRLFNGDIGILLPDPELKGEMRAFFVNPEKGVRKFLPARLPDHESAFAMTVHKSQGSEFRNCLFILPGEPTPVLTRELIYTALTRAGKGIQVWGRESLFEEGISRPTVRTSGLRDSLWEGLSE